LRLKIFDGWRPRDVQDKVYVTCLNGLRENHPDWTKDQLKQAAKMYVVNGHDPNLIPPHVTGGAVDLTLINDSTQEELGMGSRYCEWTDRQLVCDLKEGPDAEPCANLRQLVIAMLSEGFVQDPDQWWHFDYGNQKWAKATNNPIAIYGELDNSMNFMHKTVGVGLGPASPHNITKPPELAPRG
jgi:D-alanyl-D-alanine dipeptidase